MSDSAPPRSSVAHCRVSDYTPFCVAYSWSVGLDVTHKPEVHSAVIPKLWLPTRWPAKIFGRAYFIFTMLVFSTATHSRSVEVAPQNSLDVAFGPLSEMLGNHSHSISVYIRMSCVCYWNTVCRLTDTLAKTPLSTPANPIQSNSSMHRYECMVLCKDISLQRGRFCARSLASYIPRSSENRSSWMFFFSPRLCAAAPVIASNSLEEVRSIDVKNVY